MIDYSLILSINYPNSEWSLNNESYDSLIWYSDTPKPTKEELDNLYESTQDKVYKNSCKKQAISILNSTDWTSSNDVGNSEVSNPYLSNQQEFISYRSKIRALAVNPVANPVWPTIPTEQWTTSE
jgi:hypothetical protein